MHLGCAFGDLEHRQASHLKFVLGVAVVILRWQVFRRFLRPLLLRVDHPVKSFEDLGEVGVGGVVLVSLTIGEKLDLAS